MIVDDNNNTKKKFTLEIKNNSLEDTGTLGVNTMNSRGSAATTAKLNVLNVLPPAGTPTLAVLVPAYPPPVIGPLVPNYPLLILSSSTRTTTAGQYCKRCLNTTHLEEDCRLDLRRCVKCGGMGHMASACPS